MKNIILLFVLMMAWVGNSYACNDGNMMPESELISAMNGDVKPRFKSCKELPNEQCFCFKGFVLKASKLVDNMVDDVENPIWEAKSNVLACSDEADCLEKEASHECPNSYQIFRAKDNSEVYCTRIVAYEQKVEGKKLVHDSAKLAAHKAAQEQRRLDIIAKKEQDEQMRSQAKTVKTKLKSADDLSQADMKKLFRYILRNLD